MTALGHHYEGDSVIGREASFSANFAIKAGGNFTFSHALPKRSGNPVWAASY
jgi:hypothetical protein